MNQIGQGLEKLKRHSRVFRAAPLRRTVAQKFDKAVQQRFERRNVRQVHGAARFQPQLFQKLRKKASGNDESELPAFPVLRKKQQVMVHSGVQEEEVAGFALVAFGTVADVEGSGIDVFNGEVALTKAAHKEKFAHFAVSRPSCIEQNISADISGECDFCR